ncbi:YeiH family protein [Siccirubricoccus phaeus]|uniref:YeiH family protein n=1 Tax=Siccirubricoccus phaeus TaxID=2595053 RepID=UPI0011F1E2B9|nr:putative sulfate exporter family transporter [Siccirubricoccus phaeus]
MSSVASHLQRLAPGVLLCLAVSLAAYGLEWVEWALTGHRALDALVIAILLGCVLRSFWQIGPGWQPGIGFTGKTLLEVAVMLLGATLDGRLVAAAGPGLVPAVALLVLLTLGLGYGLSRALGLSPRLAMLVACGNSICGNSAIAAVAPVIGAEARDVAAAIAFTAVLGVLVVLTLPLLIPVLDLSQAQYGVMAGLTVYAVPQVLAAAAPAGAFSVQLATAVKLLRVLMLGPMVLLFSLWGRCGTPAGGVRSLTRFVPWFILGFLGLALARAAGLLPEAAAAPLGTLAHGLSVAAMAALGLGVDLRSLKRLSGRVSAAALGALLVLAGLSLGLIWLLGIA